MQQNPVSLAGLPNIGAMQTRATRLPVVLACLCAGALVGGVCLTVAVISAAGADLIDARPPWSLLWRLGFAFVGVGVVGALLVLPCVLWLDSQAALRAASARWILVAAVGGAIVGEWYAPVTQMNPYVLRVPGNLLGAFGAALATLCGLVILTRSISKLGSQHAR